MFLLVFLFVALTAKFLLRPGTKVERSLPQFWGHLLCNCAEIKVIIYVGAQGSDTIIGVARGKFFSLTLGLGD